MLNKLKRYWGYIVASVIALAYLIGINKGKQNEKTYQNNKILANLESSNRARNNLASDSAVRKRLHKKYNRQ